jgi:hypothetical protein
VLLQVSGPDETGRYNAGLGIEHLHATIGRARLVIAQVNPELPGTHGDTAIEPGLIDGLVPAAVPPMELPARPAGPIDLRQQPGDLRKKWQHDDETCRPHQQVAEREAARGGRAGLEERRQGAAKIGAEHQRRRARRCDDARRRQ